MHDGDAALLQATLTWPNVRYLIGGATEEHLSAALMATITRRRQYSLVHAVGKASSASVRIGTAVANGVYGTDILKGARCK